jgi:Multidrug resistance efflux pump
MPNRDNFYSEEVQSIIGKAPSMVVRWGVTVVFIIFSLILLGCYFIKYPDVIVSTAEIITYNPPVDLITRSDGLIDKLSVKDGDIVRCGDLIAVLSNTAEYDDILYISNCLKESVSMSHRDLIQQEWLKGDYELGDLQSSFSSFQKICIDYNHYLNTGYISIKKGLIRQQILKNSEYYAKLKEQYSQIKSDLDLQKKSFRRDSLLYSEDVISSSDFDIASQKLLQKQNENSSFKATLSSTELQIIQLKQQIEELSMQEDNEIAEYERAVYQNLHQFLSDLEKWKLQYTIVAPTSGKITFVSYWNINQHVNAGDKLASIIPVGDVQIIGRVQIPSSGFGKVKVGQNVNIKLNGYPYMEFGVLNGTIATLSAVPEQLQTASGKVIVYMADINFKHGLTTSYGKELPMIQRMDGTAEVITDNMRLISRFINPIISLFKN